MKLVTGATGFLGSYFIFYLVNSGEKVRAIKRKNSSSEQLKIAFDQLNDNTGLSFGAYLNKIEWVVTDLEAYSEIEGLLEGVDEVFHLAAKVSFNRYDREEIVATNVQSTAHLINLCLKKGVKKFHFASSIASLNRNEENVICELNDVSDKKFSTAYSKSKFLSEMEVWRGYNEGLTGVIINPGIILGPAIPSHESIRAFRTIKRGFGFYPRGRNGYVDVRDTAKIFYFLSKNPESYNERYLLVAESVKYQELFTWMSASFGIKPPSRKANIRLSYLLSYIDGLRAFIMKKRPMLTRDLVKLVNSDYIFDNSKILKAIDYKFIPVKQTIEDTCDFMLKYHN